MEQQETKRRGTRQRQIILENVSQRYDHPMADQIYEDVSKIDDKISKGTVYRNLNLLAADGKVGHIRVPGADRYDSRVDPHCHIICMKCGRVEDVPVEYAKEIDRFAEETTGYQVDHHNLVVEGLCPACQKKKPPAANG